MTWNIFKQFFNHFTILEFFLRYITISRAGLFLGIIFLSGCGIYNFTGANLHPDVKTIAIQNFVNEIGMGPPALAINFTEKLRDYFLANSSLRLAKTNGDLNMEGAIVGYMVEPLAPGGGANPELASLNRLRITVRVKFENTKDSTASFEQNFSFYDDYPQSQSLSAVESRLVETITDQIVLDIFTKAIANW